MVFRAGRARRRSRCWRSSAALYHIVNHAFKALLFLGAGAVVHATGTRDMEALGGLIKRMPWTAGVLSRSAPWPSPRCRRSTASSASG